MPLRAGVAHLLLLLNCSLLTNFCSLLWLTVYCSLLTAGMIFTETKLKGAYIIEIETIRDERGFFARTFCREEFARHGLNPCVVQCNMAFNRKRGTLRGMHYQEAPYSEAKLIGCVAGAVYDVIIDLRRESQTYRQWISVELRAIAGPAAQNPALLYVPEGFAHGYQTLEDNTYLFYQMSEFYHPESTKGIRWDDPAFAIEWPNIQPIISKKDRSFSNFTL
jgi:dTDP-4-dehydrorhamnose 3,5-epimerase